ncbi:MAG: hypothetical protein HC880_14030 [Bacteroidia bacterium]|nr:hypothetical protein [Bacteroidia bacterium]
MQEIFATLQKNYPKQVIPVQAPPEGTNLLPWFEQLTTQASLRPDVEIKKPDPDVYQIHTKF